MILATYKTSIRKNNPNPIFNEVAVFKVATKHLSSISLKIVLHQVHEHYESIFGCVYINASKKDEQNSYNYIGHWQQMLRLLRRSVRVFFLFL